MPCPRIEHVETASFSSPKGRKGETECKCTAPGFWASSSSWKTRQWLEHYVWLMDFVRMKPVGRRYHHRQVANPVLQYWLQVTSTFSGNFHIANLSSWCYLRLCESYTCCWDSLLGRVKLFPRDFPMINPLGDIQTAPSASPGWIYPNLWQSKLLKSHLSWSRSIYCNYWRKYGTRRGQLQVGLNTH